MLNQCRGEAGGGEEVFEKLEMKDAFISASTLSFALLLKSSLLFEKMYNLIFFFLLPGA